MENELVFERNAELRELLESLDLPQIKVVVGLRRAGKTYLLNELFYHELLRKGHSASSIFKADLSNEFSRVRDAETLSSLLADALSKEANIFLIDEVQLAGQGYVDALISFVKHNGGVNVFVTGSNSRCLSDDIRKAFKEMAITIKLRPLSFSQIRKTMPDYGIDDYLTYGALPIVLREKPEKRFPLLKSLYRDIYLADIRERAHGDYLSEIEKERIVVRILSNLTSPLSEMEIVRGITNGHKSSETQYLSLRKEILDFIHTVSASFLLCDFENGRDSQANKNKDFLDHDIKKYCFDLGLLNIISEAPATTKSAGAIENAVYLELISRGLNPVGKTVQKGNGHGEIDFAIEKESDGLYVQTVFALTEANRSREIGNLLALNNEGRKIVVFMYKSLLQRVPHPIETMSFENFALAEKLL